MVGSYGRIQVSGECGAERRAEVSRLWMHPTDRVTRVDGCELCEDESRQERPWAFSLSIRRAELSPAETEKAVGWNGIFLGWGEGTE